MKKLLFVDDNEDFLNSLKDFFTDYNNEFTVFTAENGKKAVDILDSMPVDLVLTDIKMPEMDGFALMSHINRKHKKTSIIVTTGHGTNAIENLVKLYGGGHYFQKPLDFITVLNVIRNELNSVVQGFIKGISLSSLLQIIELEEKTCTIIVDDGKHTGYLFFEDGILIDAEKDDVTGTDAAHQILRLNNPEIKIENKNSKRIKKINIPIMHLLLNSTLTNDEDRTNAAGIEDKDKSEQAKRKFDDFFCQKKKERGKWKALEQRMVFDEISKTDGFIAGAIFFTDGEVLTSKTSQNIDILQIGALCNELSLIAMSIAEKTDKTNISYVEVQTDRYNYLHYYVIPNLIGLGIIASQGTNTLELKNSLKKIADTIVDEFAD